MANHKFVFPEEKIKHLSLGSMVDSLGELKTEISKRKNSYNKIRLLLLKRKKQGKVLGADYQALIDISERIELNEVYLKKVLKKYVPSAIRKKCYHEVEVTRLTVRPIK
jgi:hypothetical protein